MSAAPLRSGAAQHPEQRPRGPKKPRGPRCGAAGSACVRACVRAVARQKLRSRSAAPGASPGPPPPPSAPGRRPRRRHPHCGGSGAAPAAGCGTRGRTKRRGAEVLRSPARRAHGAAGALRGGRAAARCVRAMPCRAVPYRVRALKLQLRSGTPPRVCHFFFFLPIYLFIRSHFLFSLPFLFLDFFFSSLPPPPFIFSFTFPFHLPFISPCISPRVFSLLLTSPLRGGRARSRRQQPVAGAVTEPHGCRPRRSRRLLLLLLAAAARPGSPRGRDVTKGRAYAPWKLRRLSVPS